MLMNTKKFKNVIVTGGSGFVGYYFIMELLAQGAYVYAIMRPNSRHKSRLIELERVQVIESDLEQILELPTILKESCDIFYHLGWECAQRDFYSQNLNIQWTINAVEVAKKMGCRRFVGIGSQAEYGICLEKITEETNPKPFTPYGAAKLAACHLSKIRANELKIEWIWGRLFSVYGPYDGANTLISYLIECLTKGEKPEVTNASHLWDYLYVTDAAKALCKLADTEHVDEIYNIANGDVYPLKSFIEQIKGWIAPDQEIVYGKNPRIITPLNVSVEKIWNHTGWKAEISFKEGIKNIRENNYKLNFWKEK